MKRSIFIPAVLILISLASCGWSGTAVDSPSPTVTASPEVITPSEAVTPTEEGDYAALPDGTVEDIPETTEPVTDKAGDAVDNTLDKAGDAVEKAGDAASKGADEAGDAVKRAAEDLTK